MSTNQQQQQQQQRRKSTKKNKSLIQRLLFNVVPQQIKNISKRKLFRDILFNVLPQLLALYLSYEWTKVPLAQGGYIAATLSLIGVFVLVHIILDLVYTFYIRKIRPRKRNLSKSFSGKWAIITGASSAIGAEFCFTLAESGMNILMIGRNKEKLQEIGEYITKKNSSDNNSRRHVHVRIMEHDFCNITDPEKDIAFYEKLHANLDKAISQYRSFSSHSHRSSSANASGSIGGVGFLINCVNYRNEIPNFVHDFDHQEVDRMIHTNIASTHDMIQAVLPYMIQQGPKYGGAAVVTVSSHSYHHPTPMMSLYSATNAYRSELGKCLYNQCKQHGIDFISVTPELMSSNLPRKESSNSIVRGPTAEKVVKSTLDVLGFESECFPFIGHAQSTYIPRIMWIRPWERFRDKLMQTRTEILLKQYQERYHI